MVILAICWGRILKTLSVKFFQRVFGYIVGRKCIQTDQNYQSHRLSSDLDRYMWRYCLFWKSTSPAHKKKSPRAFPWLNFRNNSFLTLVARPKDSFILNVDHGNFIRITLFLMYALVWAWKLEFGLDFLNLDFYASLSFRIKRFYWEFYYNGYLII